MTTPQYKAYMQSITWRRKKAKYWKSRYPKNCYVCGMGRHKGMHLHHRTYERLGKERLTDLVPVCASCHRFIHDFHQSNPALSLSKATEKCRGLLIKQRKEELAQKRLSRKPRVKSIRSL